MEDGPAILNAEIARLINEYEAIPSEDGTSKPPPSGPALPPRSGPHFFEPVTAGLGDLIVMFGGDLGDDRVEAELSRFARIARSRLLDVRTGRDVPVVVGNRYQLDHLDLQRVSVAPGSVDSKWIVRITLVATLWGMAATYSELKAELPKIRADVEWAIGSAAEFFDQNLPDMPPLTIKERKLTWRDESDVLQEIMDKERQALLQATEGDHPIN